MCRVSRQGGERCLRRVAVVPCALARSFRRGCKNGHERSRVRRREMARRSQKKGKCSVLFFCFSACAGAQGKSTGSPGARRIEKQRERIRKHVRGASEGSTVAQNVHLKCAKRQEPHACRASFRKRSRARVLLYPLTHRNMYIHSRTFSRNSRPR
ncbi:hypothetical protein TGPRC2_270810C [Toxoplasma gondii TgCatPRC2]|uniref:Uncharacterized protein n=1 Tax=Toxoplasma gondii TgCatPRC2 TaxID=1130821 RepID=A0A151HP38_TOXGO|nr:hypothetical protein TGPRC2_270810C [Toxoplasma gondii TgCatPRC2]